MMYSPVHLSRSLGLAWAYAGQQAAAIAARLGLGPLGVRAVLPRAMCRKLDAELKRLETIVRRVLFLVAMETPLPAFRQGPPRKMQENAAPPATAPARLVFPLPAFRLTESDPALSQNSLTEAARLAARTRYAKRIWQTAGDEPAARPGPDDFLPARGLMNRFAALEEALADPAHQVARFRRKLARIRADRSLKLPVADRLPAVCTGPDEPPVRRELFRMLHDAALSWLPILDSG